MVGLNAMIAALFGSNYAAQLGGFLIVLSLCGGSALGGGNEIILPMTVEVAEQLKTDDYKKQDDAAQLKKIVQETGRFDGIPTGQGSHDYLPIVIAVGAAFMAGFKLAKFIANRESH